jgi:hypothetical protein
MLSVAETSGNESVGMGAVRHAAPQGWCHFEPAEKSPGMWLCNYYSTVRLTPRFLRSVTLRSKWQVVVFLVRLYIIPLPPFPDVSATLLRAVASNGATWRMGGSGCWGENKELFVQEAHTPAGSFATLLRADKSGRGWQLVVCVTMSYNDKVAKDL